jgi:hypothetical protein
MNPIKKLIIIILLAVICSSFFNFFVQKGLKKYSRHTNERLTELFDNNAYHDIIFIGSSRTHTDINPKIVDSICRVNSYNFGIEGGNLFEFYYVFKSYFKNHPPPRMIVLTLDLYSFDLKRKFFNHTIYFNYTDNPAVKEMLDSNGYNTNRYKLIPFLLLTEQDDYAKGNALKGYNGITDIPDGESTYKGFMTNSENTIDVAANAAAIKFIAAEGIDTLAINYLKEIVAVCKQKNIKLIFAYSPEFKFGLQQSCSNTKQVFDIINKIANDNHIQYLRNDSLAMCKDPKLFANTGHLNRFGANAYSILLADELKNN